MALRRFRLASDNHPAYGYIVIDEISRSGEFQIETWGWTPQAAIVSLAEQFRLPSEFVPTSGSTLYRLQMEGNQYSLLTYDTSEGTPISLSLLKYVSVIEPVSMCFVPIINMYAVGDASGVTSIELATSGLSDAMWAIAHDDDFVEGGVLYFDNGTDVSVTYGLDPGTRWETATSIPSDANIAEMVFVDGAQVEGDIYYGEYGSYQMFIVEGAVHIQFVTPIDMRVQTLMFVIFDKVGEPIIHLKMRNADGSDADPFEVQIDKDGDEHQGVMVTYENFPKDNATISYYIV
jgi:hypothetical protein